MDETEKKLIAYIKASQQARRVLSEFVGLEITSSNIQDALSEVLQIPENPPLGVLDRDLTADQIIEILQSYDFKKLHPEILAEVTPEEPLLPDGTRQILTERTVKIKGEIWRIHKNDVDPFPSTPHAHNYSAGVVLHLGTGEMFDSNRKSLGTIGCKKLLRLRSQLAQFDLPSTECS